MGCAPGDRSLLDRACRAPLKACHVGLYFRPRGEIQLQTPAGQLSEVLLFSESQGDSPPERTLFTLAQNISVRTHLSGFAAKASCLPGQITADSRSPYVPKKGHRRQYGADNPTSCCWVQTFTLYFSKSRRVTHIWEKQNRVQ